MTADTVKSLSITNLDASPFVQNTAGEGAGADLQDVSDFAAVTTGGLGDTTSTYKMVRLASTVKLKSMDLYTKAAIDSNNSPTLAVDVGAYYSDSTIDGTAAANQGTSISATCFVSNKAFGDATTLKINGMSNLNANLINSPLWKQAGLTSDPGGYIDIVVAVHATAATAVAGNIGLLVRYAK